MLYRSILLAGVLLAAGCGGQGGGSHSAPPVPAATSTTAAATANAALGEGPRITLSSDNVHIEYRVYGQGDPAVLLVHGWACDENYWHAQLEALKPHYTVVTLNLAGHGASGGNRSDWSIANYAQDVAAVAREIPNPRLVLVGHSMGAAAGEQQQDEQARAVSDRELPHSSRNTFPGFMMPRGSNAAFTARISPSSTGEA